MDNNPVEGLIGLAILVVLSSIIAGGLLSNGCVTTTQREASAVRNAKVFATSMGMVFEGVACSGVDTDNDGYVSCTLNLGNEQLKAIECGYDGAIAPMGQNTGCKLHTPLTIQGP